MCPQDVSLTWSKERTRSGGDGNALPMPERHRETERQRQTGERRKSVRVQARMCAFGRRQGWKKLNWKGQQMRQEKEIN